MHIKNRVFIVILIVILVIIAGFFAFVRKAANDIADNRQDPTLEDRNFDSQARLSFSDRVGGNSVALNRMFTAKKNQRYTLQSTNGAILGSFSIVDFYNVTCPDGAQCLLPAGQNVHYTLRVSGVTYDSYKSDDIARMPYAVSIVSSDYTSYAQVIIR